MHRIHPVCAETIQPHIGQHVCIITNDGKHLYGSLDGIRGGKLYLRGGLEGPRLSAVQKHAKSAGGSRRKGLQKKQLKPNLILTDTAPLMEVTEVMEVLEATALVPDSVLSWL